MTTSDADQHLIAAVQQGDQQAWQDIIARYEGRLLSFARRRLAERSEAEDIVQETFLGLMRSLPNYDSARSLETYLFAILRNKIHDYIRRRQKGQRQSLDQLELDDSPDVWIDADTPSGYVAKREKLDQQRTALVASLRQWVEGCTEKRRFHDLVIIEMLLVLGLRNKEVAADLDMTEPAVAGVKFRVLEQWRQLTQADPYAQEWQEAVLAGNSTLAKIWREEGISCLKRSTLGRYLLGALDDTWADYVRFHVELADCDRCRANLDDLRTEDEADAERDVFRARCFASSVGFLSRPPDSN
jgi:RNA polymerase sigma-70 factor (ECF subfamily)